MTVAELLGPGRVARPSISAHLDALDKDERVAECRGLSRDQQKRLWEIASADPAEAQELLGERGAAVFAGRNSLQLFSKFEKRFARHQGALIGYNVHSLGWLTGPGYFSVTSPRANWLLFDYNHVPGEGPDGWPRVSNNDQGFAKPVYGALLDDAVWAARDVLIGSARRGDVPLDSYFVLARA
ncbi:MAG TPA: hypothetical protein VIP78_03480 [Candidatus Dormibacteraeota bacterium]